MQQGTRTGEVAEVSLREMVAHLNVIEASIDAVGRGSGTPIELARDLLSRLDVLTFSAARLHIAEMPRVTEALEELVLAAHTSRVRSDSEMAATLRHGVDVLLLLTHDKMRRMQGYPGAELRPAADALLERVQRLLGEPPPGDHLRCKTAGLSGL